MSDKELRDELMTLLVAGHETSATALAWALERADAPPARRSSRLREEIDAGDDAYLDAVVKETLRLRPVHRDRPAPADRADGDRRPHAARRRDRWRPASTCCTGAPDVYDDPRAFRPERFLEKPPGTYTWIPFGGGVRRCLGASFAQFEMKVVLRELVARLDIRAARAEPERRIRRAIVFAPERGGEIVVERRSRSTQALAA